jgi:polar amino acid transport system substrate-binding protein
MKLQRIACWMLGAGLTVSCALTQAASLRLLTEDYPPFNMADSHGKITGLATEVVRELFRRAAIPYSISLQPWIRAFNTAVLEKNTCVYSTTRSDNREHQFKWVGPLLENPWVLYAGPASPKNVFDLEGARRYSIGGYTGDATAQFLIARGFNVELTPNDTLNARKLLLGRVDFWATGKYLGHYLTQREKMTQLKPVLVFNTAFLYLACNPSVNDLTIYRLNGLLLNMRKEGFITGVTQRYQNE